MWSRNYRNEVELVGRTDAATEKKLLDLYQKKSALSDEHNAMFDADRSHANNLYRQMREIEAEMDALKAQHGVQLRYR